MEWMWALLCAVGWLTGTGADRWVGELVRLDTVRTRALVAGDPALLASVYAPDSSLRRQDEALLGGYRSRRLSLVGARLAILDSRILRREAGVVRLSVVDRLGPTWVVDDAGGVLRLPRDRPTRRTVTLVRVAGGWRIGAADRTDHVSAGPRAARRATPAPRTGSPRRGVRRG